MNYMIDREMRGPYLPPLVVLKKIAGLRKAQQRFPAALCLRALEHACELLPLLLDPAAAPQML